HGEVDVDRLGPFQGHDGVGDPLGDLGPQRAAGDGESDGDGDPAAIDRHAPNHVKVDDRYVQLGVLNRAQGINDLRFVDGHRVPPGAARDFHYLDRYNTGVDRQPLTDAEFSAAVAAVTSAFGDPTRRTIHMF